MRRMLTLLKKERKKYRKREKERTHKFTEGACKRENKRKNGLNM